MVKKFPLIYGIMFTGAQLLFSVLRHRAYLNSCQEEYVGWRNLTVNTFLFEHVPTGLDFMDILILA
jgi:hypothetical protein